MSGIEAAGIVLGAIPLLISGLQHYGRGASTIKDIFGARAECRSLARKLAVEKDILQNTVELLLGDSVDDALLEDLWTNIGGSSWSAPTIDAALRKRLARSRQRFLETLDAMNRTLQSLGARLQLGDDPKVSNRALPVLSTRLMTHEHDSRPLFAMQTHSCKLANKSSSAS